MNNIVNIIGLGHINIVVENIDEGIKFYEELLGAVPYQIFRNFSNSGFSKAAGFLENPENINLHIAFLNIPESGLTLELMQYINPVSHNKVLHNPVFDIAGVRHVALEVDGIEKAFDHVVSVSGVRLINNNTAYKPYKIDDIQQKDFSFFDKELEVNEVEKSRVVKIISNTKYFYFIDKYGVQWEFEEGHTDIGKK